jgi:hypothetical protein
MRRIEAPAHVLAPHARHNVVMGSARLLLGSAARSLGQLAGVVSLFDAAERHFEDALEMHLRMGAEPWVAHTRYDYARMLLARGSAQDLARAQGLLHGARSTAEALGMNALSSKLARLRA